MSTRQTEVIHVSENYHHECELCLGPEYQRAIAVLKRSGLPKVEENYGYLLHDMVSELVFNRGQYQIQEYGEGVFGQGAA